MVIMASGIACGCVRTTTTTMATRNMAAKHQIYETCSLGLPCTSFMLEIHVMNNRPFPIYYNSNVAPRFGGIKQKKLIIHPSTSLLFLLYYSPKPRSQVRILIYRKWSIDTCQFKVSADQYYVAISQASVKNPSRSRIFWNVTTD